jgi:hypothetical protein
VATATTTTDRWLRQPQAIFAAVFLAFAFCLLLPYLGGHWRLADDSYENTVPVFSFVERVLRGGEWPHWNLNEGLGKPFAINAGVQIFYPVALVWGLVVGWSEWSYLFFLLLHLWAGGWLAAAFGRKLGFTTPGAVVLGLAFVGNGYVLGLLSNPSLLVPVLLAPLLGITLVELHSPRPRVAWATRWLAVALVLIETGGYPLTKILVFASVGAIYLALTWKRGPAWKPILLASAVALAISAPEWVQTLRAMGASDRMASDIYSDVTYGSPTSFLSLGTLLFPSSFLRRDDFQLGAVWLERSWWVGTLTLGLIFAGLSSGKLKLTKYRAAGVVALVALLFSMGGHSFVRELFSDLLPLLAHLRFANGARLIPMAFLAFAAAAALTALEGGAQGRSSEKPPEKDPAVARAWAAFGLACGLLALSSADWHGRASELYFDAATGWKVDVLHAAFYPLLAWTAYRLRWELGAWRWPVLVAALQFLSLADAGYSFRHLIAKPSDRPPGRWERFTYASPQPNERSTKRWLDGDDWISWQGNKKVLRAYSEPGFASLKPALADPRIEKLSSTLVSCQDDAQAVIGLPAPVPYSCQGLEFRIDRYFGERIELSGSGPKPALIVVHDFNDPRWHATLDGAEMPIFTAYGWLKAAAVPATPPGERWHLVFEYREPAFAWLLAVSGAGLLALAGVGLVLGAAPARARKT